MSIVLVFASIHHALAAEKDAGLAAAASPAFAGQRPPELIPLPASVKSDCGFGLLVEGPDCLDDERMIELDRKGVKYLAAYRRIGKERSYERID